MLWPIGSCQNRVCADQHHMTVARAQVSTHRGCEFFELIRLQVAGSQLIAGSTPSGFLCNDCKCIVWSKLQIYQRVLRLFPWLNLYIRLEFFFFTAWSYYPLPRRGRGYCSIPVCHHYAHQTPSLPSHQKLSSYEQFRALANTNQLPDLQSDFEFSFKRANCAAILQDRIFSRVR